MNCTRVTITGADDSTDINQLFQLSHEFPFVEWGILVSKRNEGSYRFPGREWIDRFSAVASAQKWNVSTHVCGRWTRELLVGELDWSELPTCLDVSQRVQINTHAERLQSTVGMFANLEQQRLKKFIFQWDGVNDHMTFAAFAAGFEASALFDTSGGAGILPASWPSPHNVFPCGYAGGLGPANVVEQIEKIESVCTKPYWIDMERRVRTQDDSALDMSAVRAVLVSVQSLQA